MQPQQPLMNFNNRGGGNIRVHSATQCTTPPQYWPLGQPDVDPMTNFCLRFWTRNISVCNGCRNKFDKQATPPNDLCAQHAEWWTYTSPVTSQPESRYGNAYYHANPSCIIHKWPRFHPGTLEIPSDILHLLKPEYKHIISTLFGITIRWFTRTAHYNVWHIEFWLNWFVWKLLYNITMINDILMYVCAILWD